MDKETKLKKQREIIFDFFDYFKTHKFNETEPYDMKFIKAAVVLLSYYELSYMGINYDFNNPSNNDVIFKLINNPSKNFLGECITDISHGKSTNYGIKRTYITMNIGPIASDLSDNSTMTRIKACQDFVKTVFHELRHFRQFLMTQLNISSPEALYFARDFVLTDFVESDFYTNNYKNFAIEADASETEAIEFMDITGINNNQTLRQKALGTRRKLVGMYKADSNSIDGNYHWDSHGFKDRDIVSISILDDIITKKGNTQVIEKYPILGKEYNPDGSKKTTYQLFQNMFAEEFEYIHNPDLSNSERLILIKDSREMYYELLIRTFNKCSKEETSKILTDFGKTRINKILTDMKTYFDNQFNEKTIAATRARSRMKSGTFQAPSNDSTTIIKIKGKSTRVPVTEIYRAFDETTLNKPIGNGLTFRNFLSKSFIMNKLPQFGNFYTKDGHKMDIKCFFETYLLPRRDLSYMKNSDFYLLLKEKTETYPEVQFLDTLDRLTKFHHSQTKHIEAFSKNINSLIYFPTILGYKSTADMPFISFSDLQRLILQSKITESEIRDIKNAFIKREFDSIPKAYPKPLEQ